MYYVYLLQLADNAIYTGSTKDIKNRFEKHVGGNVLATKVLHRLKRRAQYSSIVLT